MRYFKQAAYRTAMMGLWTARWALALSATLVASALVQSLIT